jgi:hypothetical protein
MKLHCEFNTDLQRWEYAFTFKNAEGIDRVTYTYENPETISETMRRLDLVNWLNKCFDTYDQETSPSQQT